MKFKIANKINDFKHVSYGMAVIFLLCLNDLSNPTRADGKPSITIGSVCKGHANTGTEDTIHKNISNSTAIYYNLLPTTFIMAAITCLLENGGKSPCLLAAFWDTTKTL